MNEFPAFNDLIKFQRDIYALKSISGLLSWDQETMMPEGAAEQRSHESAAIEKVIHQYITSNQLSDLLTAAEHELNGDNSDGAQDIESPHDLALSLSLPLTRHAVLRETRKTITKAQALPEDLVGEIARQIALGQNAWAAARQANDFNIFAPKLSEIIRLRRQQAQALIKDSSNLYDALLDEYEPGITANDLTFLFSQLRPHLINLSNAIHEKSKQNPNPAPSHTFDEAIQIKLATLLAKQFGYDFYHGRLDKAVHPFSSGGGQDVRITTRTSPPTPFNCLYSTIHEVGHACYEQNIDDTLFLTILGNGVSMGVHESQSRIYENQFCRSREFCYWLYQKMKTFFGDFGINDAESFYRWVNNVQKSYIRTESDEVHYNLHVFMRFDLERQLISGDLAVNDLPYAWNDRFAKDFGFAVDGLLNGCLQDIHWSAGLFGYFPTYSLGNIYAGCLYKKITETIPNLPQQLSKGDLSQAVDWLKTHIHRFGGLYKPKDLIEKASGHPFESQPLIDYLVDKFSDLYDLSL